MGLACGARPCVVVRSARRLSCEYRYLRNRSVVTSDNRQPPPFVITRVSHVELNVTDLAASRRFYEEVIGLSVVDADNKTLFLRGVEERCHHSLVLQQRDEPPTCERVGFRVETEAELEKAKEFFVTNDRAADWTDVAYQELTLRVADRAGAPIEFCAHMPADSRREVRFDLLKGGAPARLDHIQIHTADIRFALSFYLELGFRISEYASEDGTLSSPLRSVFLARKGNANDIVLASNQGPRLHHLAYVVHDASTTLLRVCDVAAAMGMRDSVEWGPGRHGLGNERFLYLRDPDGHRIELLSHPYQLIDLEDESYGWSTDRHDIAALWGPGAPDSWRQEASSFRGVQTQSPASPGPRELSTAETAAS
jgi:catechol 2,3-dioxygenase